MTNEQYKRASEIKRQIAECKKILAFENEKNVIFPNNNCGFMQKELFEAVKNKMAKIEREFCEL